MKFLLKLCARVAMEINSLEDGRSESSREKHFVATMAVSSIFASICDRNDNFGQFSSMGGYRERAQQYLLDLLFERFAANWAEISKCVCSLHQEVDPDTLQPYTQNARPPNVLSFFHLVFQSLSSDFVSPQFTWQF
jgi:hypothetical protein